MASVDIYVNEKLKDKLGRISIVLQVIHNRKPKRKTLFAIKPEDWDFTKNKVRVSEPSHNKYNQYLIETLAAVQVNVLSLKPNDLVNFDSLMFTAEDQSNKSKTPMLSDYYEKFAKYCEKNTSYGYYKNVVSFLRELTLLPDVPIKDVTSEWISNLQKEMKVKPSTFRGKLKKLRRALKFAIKDKINVPEDAFEYVVKVPRSIKRKLNTEHLIRLFNLDLSGNLPMQQARDFVKAQFFLLGMRSGDLLTLRNENVVSGRIDFWQSKTEGQQSIVISPEVMEIFDRYAAHALKYGYLMPFMKIDPKVDEKLYHEKINKETNRVNLQLKELAKIIGFPYNFTTHTIRHTVATMSDKLGIAEGVIQNFLGHANVSTTKGYIEDLTQQDDVDEAALMLFQLLRS